jgi:hypothetical protein
MLYPALVTVVFCMSTWRRGLPTVWSSWENVIVAVDPLSPRCWRSMQTFWSAEVSTSSPSLRRSMNSWWRINESRACLAGLDIVPDHKLSFSLSFTLGYFNKAIRKRKNENTTIIFLTHTESHRIPQPVLFWCVVLITISLWLFAHFGGGSVSPQFRFHKDVKRGYQSTESSRNN